MVFLCSYLRYDKKADVLSNIGLPGSRRR